MPKLVADDGWSIVWASELEDFFNAVSGIERDWSYAEAMDCPSQNSMEKIQVPDYDLWAEETNEGESWDMWYEGGNFGYDFYPLTPSVFCVMHWMVEMGKIPAGKYVVEVWW